MERPKLHSHRLGQPDRRPSTDRNQTVSLGGKRLAAGLLRQWPRNVLSDLG